LRKKVGILLICTLLLTMIAPLAGSAETDPLWDIKPTDWFYKSVQEMYARGMIQGVKDNDLISFKPNDQVTQTQALAMVIRYLGLESAALEMKEDEITRRFQQLGIDNGSVEQWARGYIAEAIGLGYVKTKNDALSTPATRAWISQLLVRVVQKESLALSSTNANKNTGMMDDASIPNNVRGYINAALSLNLMNGISEYGKVYFQHNGITSRAQMATLLKRLDDHLAIPTNLSKEVVIKELGETNITVQDKDGRFETLPLANPAVFFENEKRSLLNLSKADKVRIAVRNQQVVFIDWLGKGELIENVVTGTVDEVNKEYKLLLVKVVKEGTESIETFTFNDQVQIYDAQYRKLSLDDLKKGQEIDVLYENNKTVREIKVKGSSGSGVVGETVDGEFLYLNQQEKRITMMLDNGTPQTYKYDENTILIYNKMRFASITDIRKGDRIRVTVGDPIKQIEVLEVSKETSKVTGTVVTVAEKEAILTVKVENVPVAYKISPQVTIILTGVPNPSLKDLKEGDQVTMDVKEGLVTKIEVGNRSYLTELKGRLISVDTKNRLINFTADNGELLVKELADKVDVIVEGSQSSLESLAKNMRLFIRLEDNKVTRIELDNIRTGYIKSIDSVSRKLVITHADGLDTTYTMITNVPITILDIAAPKITDLKVGQEVQFYLNIEDEIKKLNVITKADYLVYAVKTDTKQIQVLKSGNVQWFAYTDKTLLQITGKENPKWDEIKGFVCSLTFAGKDLIKVEKK